MSGTASAAARRVIPGFTAANTVEDIGARFMEACELLRGAS